MDTNETSTSVSDFLAQSLGLAPEPEWMPPAPEPEVLPPPAPAILDDLGISGELLEHNPKYELILSELYEYANIAHACRVAGVNRRTMYNWRLKDPEFDKACVVAYQAGMQALEDAVVKRAQIGYDEPVFYNGVECGVKRKFSDGLAQFILEGNMPEKYRKRLDARVENVGPLNTLVIPATENLQDWLTKHGG